MRRFSVLALLAAALLVLVLGSGGVGSLLAQETVTPGADETPVVDETPGAAESRVAATGRPSHIFTGACGGELGDIVQGLTNLEAPEGNFEGQGGAVVAERSFTTAPMSLDDMLAKPHSIDVHHELSSGKDGDIFVACGEIGGVRGADGSLVIGLKEVFNRNENRGSGITGIAVLAPNEAHPDSTDVSVFIAEDLAQ